MKTEKVNCYDCIHRREVPGSAHSFCAHPDTEEVHSSSMAQIMSIIGKSPVIPCRAVETLKIRAHQHGIRMGWFSWPLNFDPVWLEHCEGFTRKEAQ